MKINSNNWFKKIEQYPDFPIKNVLFYNIFPVYRDTNLFDQLIHDLIDKIKNKNIDCIIAVEARGFVIAPVISYILKIPFVVVRKKGKICGETYQQKYNTEYSQDVILEIRKDEFRNYDKNKLNICIFDDVLATGNTIWAVCKLLQNFSNIDKIYSLNIITLSFLKGEKKINNHVEQNIALKYINK